MPLAKLLPVLILAAALAPAQAARAQAAHPPAKPLIVIGFMGGNVHATNLVHREALLAQQLQQLYPQALHAAVFANHDAQNALDTILQLLDANHDGNLTAAEKNAARIVIYGHSWGASETVTLARRLDQLGIPVLMTIQVDSVAKTDGLLHGRTAIAAIDPNRTTILGNFLSSYRGHPISCAGFPWFARAFMKPHIEIENDPAIWTKIEDLIRTKL
jgi:hypothetical protein